METEEKIFCDFCWHGDCDDINHRFVIQTNHVKQFLADKLNKIEKEIENYPKDKGSWHKYYIRTKDVKQLIKKVFG